MKIIGHRGARGLAPENTIASIEKAIEHGVDEIEFDIRLTGDNLVILNHDKYLTDQSGSRLLISDHRYGELKAHKQDLTLLQDAVKTVGHRAKLIIEIKPGVKIEPIVEVINELLGAGWKTNEMTFCSFSFDTLSGIHKLLPEINVRINERWSGVRATSRARKLNTKLISMNQRWLWWGFIKYGGYDLYAYTLNEPAKAIRWSKHGLAGVITDYPDLFQK